MPTIRSYTAYKISVTTNSTVANAAANANASQPRRVRRQRLHVAAAGGRSPSKRYRRFGVAAPSEMKFEAR